MPQPFFSIIIPIYNAEEYLRQCIDSILSQRFSDFELWLVDDGSADTSPDIIKEYAKADKRIKIAHTKSGGPSAPRNYALRRCRGQYVMFVDSDDYIPAGTLDIFADNIDKKPKIDYILGRYELLVPEGAIRQSRVFDCRVPYANKVLNGNEFLSKVLNQHYHPHHSAFRTEFIRKNHIEFPEDMVTLEDGPFIVEVCAAGANCMYIDDCIYVYRYLNPNSVSNIRSYSKPRVSANIIGGGITACCSGC